MKKSHIPNPKSPKNPNYQNSNDRNKRCLKFGTWCLFVIWCLIFGIFPAFAQEEDKLVGLSKQIIEAKTNEDLYAPFEELRGLYFSRPAIKSEGGIPPEAGKDNRYAGFVEFLKSLESKRKTLEPFTSYYTALTRYSQLKYLEEKQAWDEYFAQGNTYREEIVSALEKAIDVTIPKDVLNIYSRLLLWQFHRDQQDAFAEQSLSDLMNSVLEYSKDTKDIKPIKEVADKFSAYAEKGKSKELYKIYADKIAASDTKEEELGSIASNFYKEGNLELAETIYDIYLDRITKSLPQEKLIPLLIEIAQAFSYKDVGANDALYAEKIFAKIEEIGGRKAFDQELIYLRAFSLEKAKEYQKAKDNYVDLAQRYPAATHNDEAVFKSGIISTYVLRDIKQGRSYFEKLAQKETISPQVISSLYQLGLLSQWEGDNLKAREYYDNLTGKAAGNFSETVNLAQERLREMNEGKPIEYNLKTFLDLSLKEENAMFDMTKFDLNSHPYRVKKNEDVNINASSYFVQSGCMQVELQYLWSGHTGTKKPSLAEATFNTTYKEPGSKEINLVIVSPAGIVDRSIDIADVD